MRFKMLKDDNRIQLDLYDNLKVDKIELAGQMQLARGGKEQRAEGKGQSGKSKEANAMRDERPAEGESWISNWRSRNIQISDRKSQNKSQNRSQRAHSNSIDTQRTAPQTARTPLTYKRDSGAVFVDFP